MIDMFDKECELAQDVVVRNQKDLQRVAQNLDTINKQLTNQYKEEEIDGEHENGGAPNGVHTDVPVEKDRVSELAKIEFSLEKTEERYKDTTKYFENQVKRSFKAVSLKWIDVEDALKQWIIIWAHNLIFW